MLSSFSWDDLRIFLAVARAGSLGGASRELGIDGATVSRRFASLEASFGTRLATRARGGITLTEEGEELRRLAATLESSMLTIERRRQGLADTPTGTVRLATSSILSAGLLAPHLPTLRAREPAVLLELVIGRRLVDLSRREADLALRLRPAGGKVAEPSSVARKLADVGFAAYGTRAAVERPGPVVRYVGFEPGARWAEGRLPSVRVDDVPTALALAQAGAGLAVLPCFLADETPGLVRASEVLETHALHVAVHPELRAEPRVVSVRRWIADVVEAERERLRGA